MAQLTAQELGRWFDAAAPALVLYARQWVRAAVAEDLVQEVFVRLAQQRERPANVRAWLLVCVRHAALDAVKRERRRAARDHAAGEERATALAAPADVTGLDSTEVQAALEALPTEMREIITLKIWAGATFEEIAGVMGMPLATVYQRYRSGLESLRSRWELPCRKR